MDFFGDLIFVLKKTVPLPADIAPAGYLRLYIFVKAGSGGWVFE